MPKKARSATGRKPPEPTDSHAEIAQWIERLTPTLRPIVKHLDKLIRETVPGLQFAFKWRKAHYGLEKHGWIIEIASYDISVNIVLLCRCVLRPAAATRVGVCTLHQAHVARGGKGTGDWKVDQAGCPRAGVEVTGTARNSLHTCGLPVSPSGLFRRPPYCCDRRFPRIPPSGGAG